MNFNIAKLVIVTNKNLVRVYIKKDSLQKPYYKEKLSKGWPNIKEEGPHFEFNVTKSDEFEKRLNEWFAKNPNLEVPYSPKQEGEWFVPILNFLLPLLVMRGE